MKIRNTSDGHSNGLKILVYGGAGHGKTSLISTSPEKPLVISAEAGLMPLKQSGVDYVEVKSFNDCIEVLNFIEKSEDAKQYGLIALDSISEMAELNLADEKRNAKDPRQAYGAMQDQITDLIRRFRDLHDKHVYFSAKQERAQDGDTGRLLYAPSFPGNKLAQNIPYFFDEVFALRVERNEDGELQRFLQTSVCNQYIAKDRSGVLEQFETADLSVIAAKIMN